MTWSIWIAGLWCLHCTCQSHWCMSHESWCRIRLLVIGISFIYAVYWRLGHEQEITFHSFFLWDLMTHLYPDIKIGLIKLAWISKSPISQRFFPQWRAAPTLQISSWVITTPCRLYSNISQILLLYKTWRYYNKFDSTKSLGVRYRCVKIPRCG